MRSSESQQKIQLFCNLIKGDVSLISFLLITV